MKATRSLLAVVLVGCASQSHVSAPTGSLCAPNEQVDCACPSGVNGTQHCLANGTFSACTCNAEQAPTATPPSSDSPGGVPIISEAPSVTYAAHDIAPCLAGGNRLVLAGQTQDVQEPISLRRRDIEVTPFVNGAGETVTLVAEVPNGETWTLSFTTGKATESLREGDYIQAKGTIERKNKFALSTKSTTSCNNPFVTRFQVHAFAHDYHKLKKFAATFEQQCSEALPPIFGCIHFEATR